MKEKLVFTGRYISPDCVVKNESIPHMALSLKRSKDCCNTTVIPIIVYEILRDNSEIPAIA
jgi:hypothetical protein